MASLSLNRCRRFSQNAWKKDLCANCFKSKEEHQKYEPPPVAIPTVLSDELKKQQPKQSILKVNDGSKEGVRGERRAGPTGRVKFLAEESEVIGYGGDDDFDFSDDDSSESNTAEEPSDGCSDQDDIDLQRLTKSNTDFNSIVANLTDSNETDAKKNKCRIPLQLGRPDLDADGRKCTLLVSVKPFGSSSGSEPEPAKINKPLYSSNDSDKNNRARLKDDKIVKQETDNVNTSNDQNEKAGIINDHITDSCLYEKANGVTKNANVVQQNTVEDVIAVPVDNPCDSINRSSSFNEPEAFDISQKRVSDDNDEHITNVENKRGTTLLSRGIMLTKNHQQVVTKRFQLPSPIVDGTDFKPSPDAVINDQNNDSGFLSKRNDKNALGYDYGSVNLNVNGSGLRQKNYKNILASDENKIKCLSFKDYQSGLGFDYYQEEEEAPLTSRESAGEPDGRADPDSKDEPLPIRPALPLSPPPSGCRSPPSTPPPPPPSNTEDHPPPRISFLHSLRSGKVQQQQRIVNDVLVNRLPPSTEINCEERLAVAGTGPSQEESVSQYCNNGEKLIDCDPNQLLQHQPQTIMKRQAPKPPLSPAVTSVGNTNEKGENMDSDNKAREKHNHLSLNTNCGISNGTKSASPDALSYGSPFASFAQLSPSSSGPVTKRGSKVRSTLRKLLRFGSRSDEDFLDECQSGSAVASGTTVVNSLGNGSAAIRTRPEIIHPLDLNKSGVQVLCKTTNNEKLHGITKMDDLATTSPLLRMSPNVNQHYGYVSAGRPSKPPPPPRSQSLEMSCRGPAPPARPPPPLSAASTSIVQLETGNLRSEVKPSKPNRAASHKDSEDVAVQNQKVSESRPYENIMIRTSATVSGDPVVASSGHALSSYVSYCGSETESDIGYNGGIISNSEVPGAIATGLVYDDLIESDGWRSAGGNGKKKHRSVIHSSLEENYSAVIIANHEALSQLLEQANRYSPLSRSLDIFKSGDPKPRWTDFVLDESVEPVAIGYRKFYAARYKGDARLPLSLTLCLNCVSSGEAAGLVGDKLPNSLRVITEFTDFIPNDLVNFNNNKKAVMSNNSSESNDTIEVIISVLERQVIESFFLHNWPSLSAGSLGAVDRLNLIKEAGSVLYQLINCLLSLQDRAINFIHKSDVILCKILHDENEKDFDDNTLRLCLLSHRPLTSISSTLKNVSADDDRVSLHQCVIDSLDSMPLPSHLSAPLTKLAAQHSNSTSLSQAKALLELWLWGPPGDVVATPLAERHHIIQRWLDLEKANVLQSLLMACPLPLKLNTHAHCHLSFLVQTNAKVIDDALTFFTDFHSTKLNSNTEC